VPTYIQRGVVVSGEPAGATAIQSVVLPFRPVHATTMASRTVYDAASVVIVAGPVAAAVAVDVAGDCDGPPASAAHPASRPRAHSR